MPGLKEKGKKKSPAASIIEFVVIIVVALLLAVGIQAFLVKPFRIPSPSMVPTLEVGQRVLVDRVSDHFSDPGRGDILVFKPPRGADQDVHTCGSAIGPDNHHPCAAPTAQRSSQNYIKRVVGLPGEWLKVLNNRVFISKTEQGPYKEISESYIAKNTPCDDSLCNLPEPIQVPAGHFFMMGDNRGQSDDSRDWGPIPKKWVIGRALFTYWPPDRIGTL